MGKSFPNLTVEHSAFIQRQKMFFVATAPLRPDFHVNLSPKGSDSFRVIHEKLVGYMDFIGSGNETSAHILENGRITLMFCAFDGPPRILRVFGSGRVVLRDTPEWAEFVPYFPVVAHVRQLILVEVESVQTSCGYTVPFYKYEGERSTMEDWVQKKGAKGLEEYVAEKNSQSKDGLPTHLGQAHSK